MRFTPARKITLSLTSIALASCVYLMRTPEADACGCFAPPDPSVEIIQGGERIVFAMAEGKVTAHIQIQYSGDAEEFAWLVPLPSVPVMTVGTDELFNQIISVTQPKYRVNRQFAGSCAFDPTRGNGAPNSGDSAGNPAPQDPDSPLVVRDTVGPYDYAVLSAESKDPMLQWLADERFFVPAGTEDVVDPYIHPGAYFLALKLRKDVDVGVGDLQPVVLEYESELPMIPIVLTSVAADPDMPVMVWVLGESRAIPRNFFHTQINDALIDWLNFGSNYVQVVTDAVDEAEGHHSFVTEYAGTSQPMIDRLDPPGRFGSLVQLGQITDAISYVEYMFQNGYATFDPNGFFQVLSSQILSILDRYLPVPAGLLEEGTTANEYYSNMRWYIETYRLQRPDLFEDLDLDYDAAELTAELEERIVVPTLAAGQMFRDNSYMSRLFTTLSPTEMTKDPVFSFNPDLPEVSNIHESDLVYMCGFASSLPQSETPARLITESGWELYLPRGEASYDWLSVPMPSSLYTQILREEGPPEIVGDNADAIRDAIARHSQDSSGGCAVSAGAGHSGLLGVILLGLFALVSIRRRR